MQPQSNVEEYEKFESGERAHVRVRFADLPSDNLRRMHAARCRPVRMTMGSRCAGPPALGDRDGARVHVCCKPCTQYQTHLQSLTSHAAQWPKLLNASLEEVDPELYDIIEHEKNRQYKVRWRLLNPIHQMLPYMCADTQAYLQKHTPSSAAPVPTFLTLAFQRTRKAFLCQVAVVHRGLSSSRRRTLSARQSWRRLAPS